MPKIADRSELRLLAVTVAFQIATLIALFRVATGTAAVSLTENSTSAFLIIPSNFSQSLVIPETTLQFVNPGGNSLGASLVLVLFFLAANVAVIGFLAYLYRKRRMKLFSLIVSLFLIFVATLLYSEFFFGYNSYIPIVASFFAFGLTVIAAVRGIPRITNVLALVVALELGGALAVLLQYPLNWLIPAVYAVFDIYAVYYGRLGKLVIQVSKSEEESAKGEKSESQDALRAWPDFGLLSMQLGSLEIGMADVAFYSMVPAVALLITNLLGFLFVLVGVDIGLILSFTLFRKSDVSPGLPVPILLGLGVLLVFSLLT